MSKTVECAEMVQAKWAASTTLDDAVPGGLIYDRLTKPTLRPYASFKVVEGERIDPSGSQYVQAFTVTVKLWAQNGTSVPKSVSNTLDGLFDFKTLTDPVGVQLMTIVPKPGTLEDDAATKDGEDVLLLTKTWEIWLQITRP